MGDLGFNDGAKIIIYSYSILPILADIAEENRQVYFAFLRNRIAGNR